MSFTGKFNAGMSSIAKTMKNSADNYKLEGKIAEQKKIIKVLTKEITNLVMVRLEAGDEMYPEIMERYAAIQEAEEAIELLKKERKITKTTCPMCGVKTSVDMNYCGKCGASLKAEEADEEEIIEAAEETTEEVKTEEIESEKAEN